MKNSSLESNENGEESLESNAAGNIELTVTKSVAHHQTGQHITLASHQVPIVPEREHSLSSRNVCNKNQPLDHCNEPVFTNSSKITNTAKPPASPNNRVLQTQGSLFVDEAEFPTWDD